MALGQLLDDDVLDREMQVKVSMIPANAVNTAAFKIDVAIGGRVDYPAGAAARKDGFDIRETTLMTGTLEDHIEQTFAPFVAFPQELRVGGESGQVEQSMGFLRGQRTSPSFLRGLAGGDVRLGSLPDDPMTAVVCRTPGERSWRIVGKFASLERALAAAAVLIGLAQDLTAALRQIYIVEHTLLRFARLAPDQEGSAGFAYSFTISVVVSAEPGDLDPKEYRAGVREVIRRNAPSHIVVECCFLRPHRMARFEQLYRAWQQALRRGDLPQIIVTSTRLRSFLESVTKEETG